jgi:hypothetical protein
MDRDSRNHEQLISLQEAAKIVARLRGPEKRPCHSTLWRWGTRGLKGAKLEMWSVGHQWVTSKEAVSRFLRASQQQRSQGPAAIAPSYSEAPPPATVSVERTASAMQSLKEFTGGASRGRGPQGARGAVNRDDIPERQ